MCCCGLSGALQQYAKMVSVEECRSRYGSLIVDMVQAIIKGKVAKPLFAG